ncbi:hypothetical protein VNI00_015216 [Paramarasmius palmivorus]|uniref:Uncharacterized protein n=1 Tax=Paramarasmius palmivorus TaxID=297713 RepID=A0AAW0BM87_9AGAR
MASSPREGADIAIQDVQVLRFPEYDVEKALRQYGERALSVQNVGQLPADVLELDYEVVDVTSVPGIHERLHEVLQCTAADSTTLSAGSPSLHARFSLPTSLLKPPSAAPAFSLNAEKPSSACLPASSSTAPPASQISSQNASPHRPRSSPPKPSKRPRYKLSPGKPGKKLNARQMRALRKTELARNRRRQTAKDRDAQSKVEPRVIGVAQSAEPVVVGGFNAASMPSSEPAWIGTKGLPKSRRPSASKLRDLRWNGKATVVLLDALDRIWAVLGAPPPKAKDWKNLNDGLMRELEEYDRSSLFNASDMSNRRAGGAHGLRNAGVSHGGGQPRPGNIAIRGIKNQAAIKAFSTSSYLGRLVGHTGRLYATFANRLAAESRRVLKELGQNIEGLQFPSHSNPEGGYWAARCINSAGLLQTAAVCTLPHTDLENWAPGWCCVTAIGDYDPDKGGHLILWNVGLRIRFPPGCSILFPSAVITHSNTPIQQGERRYSIVEFSAGGLFRWVYNGFRTDEELLASLNEDGLRKWSLDKATRWKKEVRMYTKWYELERGDYRGVVLEEESDLSELSELEDDRPTKKQRI